MAGPKYFDNGTYPVDIQCAAQAIETLAAFSDERPECLDQALRVADWTIDNMQAPDGQFSTATWDGPRSRPRCCTGGRERWSKPWPCS